LPNAPQMPDALGGMRSGKSTALRGWTRCGITETLKALITLKGSQWFSGRAQIDEPVASKQSRIDSEPSPSDQMTNLESCFRRVICRGVKEGKLPALAVQVAFCCQRRQNVV
jgi:hypothetical protein